MNNLSNATPPTTEQTLSPFQQKVQILLARFDLRTKLVVAFVLVTLLPLLLLTWFNYQSSQAAIIERTDQTLSSAALQTVTKLDAFFDNAADNLLVSSQIPLFETYLITPPNIRQGSTLEREVVEAIFALSARRNQLYISSYALLDATGLNLVDTAQGNIGNNESTQDYFTNALRLGQPYISSVFFPDNRGTVSFFISVPIRRDTTGEILGVLRVQYTLVTLQDFVTTNNGLAGEGSFAILVDENGLVLAQSNGSDRLFKLISNLETAQVLALQAKNQLPQRLPSELFANQPDLTIALENSPQNTIFTAQGFTPNTANQELRGAIVQTQNKGFTIFFMQSSEAYLQPVQRQALNTVLLSLLMMGLTAIFGFGAAQLLTTPVSVLRQVAQQVISGDRNIQVELSPGLDGKNVIIKDDVLLFGQAFNQMLQQLRDSVENLEARVTERTEAIARSAEISRRIPTFEQPAALIEYTATQIHQHFNADYTHIFLTENDSTNLILAEAIGPHRQAILAEELTFELGKGIVGMVAETAEPYMANNVLETSYYLPHPLLEKTRSELVIPLLKGEEILGVIDVNSHHLNYFQEEDVTFIRPIATQLAITLDNLRLLRETQTTLEQVKLLNRRMTREGWDETIEQEETPGFHYRNGQIEPLRGNQLLIDANNTLLEPMQKAAHSKELVQSLHVGNGGPPHAELAVPLILRDEVIGVVSVKRHSKPSWAEEELTAVETVASQLARALDNARLAQEQEKTIIQLQEIDRLKSEFLTSMSHELRTPLNSIIGFADILLQGIDGELNDYMTTDSTAIYNSGKPLLALINDILDLSKIEAGRMELVQEELNVADAFNDVAASVSSLLQNKPVDLLINVQDNLPLVWADPVRFNQVVINLVSNAIKFTEQGLVMIRAKLDDAGMVQIAIEDTGIGIPQDKLDLVFERFRQVDSRVNRKYQGTGMGLAIARQLAEMHGGKMWLESTVGEGTTFFFTVPPIALKHLAPAPILD
jgi:signal transduction histidine kinase/HAMP domain-containing protein